MTDNPTIRIYIYIYKIENRITFNNKTGHYLILLMSATIKLHGRNKINIKGKWLKCVSLRNY